MSKTTKVFLSSVGRTLRDCRDQAYKAIEGLDGYHCVRMEDFGARDGIPRAFCEGSVGDCDIFMCLAGVDYGNCPPGTTKSFSELEYEEALATDKPILAILANPEFKIASDQIDPDALRARQRAFRERLTARHVVSVFDSVKDVAKVVTQAIFNFNKTLRTPVETVLLFPFVTTLGDWDTFVTISNIASTPKHQFGPTPFIDSLGSDCKLYIYPPPGASGSYEFDKDDEGKLVMDSQGIPVFKFIEEAPRYPGEALLNIARGTTFGTILSSIVGHQIDKGYLIAECAFPARGFAVLITPKQTATAQAESVGSYVAEILSPDHFHRMNQWIEQVIESESAQVEPPSNSELG